MSLIDKHTMEAARVIASCTGMNFGGFVVKVADSAIRRYLEVRTADGPVILLPDEGEGVRVAKWGAMEGALKNQNLHRDTDVKISGVKAKAMALHVYRAAREVAE